MRYLLALILAIVTVAIVTPGAAYSQPASGTGAAKPPTSWEEPVKLDARGYIRQWLILGPINFGEKYNPDDIDKDQIKDEAKLMPKAGDKVTVATEEGQPSKTVQKELTWKAVKTDDFSFDLNQILHGFLGLAGPARQGIHAQRVWRVGDRTQRALFSRCAGDFLPRTGALQR